MNKTAKSSILPILALFIVPFDFVFFILALPLLQELLNIPISTLYWILNALFLSLVIFSPLCSQIALKASTKATIFIALILYAFCPLLFFFQISFSAVILIRVIQGFALALLIPSALQTCLDHSKQKFYILPLAPLLAIFAALFIAPFLKGPFIFALPSIYAALLLLGIPFVTYEKTNPLQLDHIGAGFSGSVFGLFFLAIIGFIFWSIGIGIMIFFLAFLILQLTFYLERKIPHPLLQLRILKDKFCFSTIVPLFIFQFTLWATLVLLILYIKAVQNHPTIYLVIPFISFGVSVYLGSLFSLPAYKKKLVKSCITLSLFLASSAYFLLSLIISKSSIVFLSLPLILLGFSFGILYLNSFLEAKLIFAKPLLLKGFIFYETLQYLAAATGLSVGLYLFIKNFKSHFYRLLEMSGNPYNGSMTTLFLDLYKNSSLLFPFKRAFISSCSYGLHTVTALFAWLLFLTLIFCAVFINAKTANTDHHFHH